ncbi:MAG: SCP2 sterol-binding domain-containing protein [Chloroflexota bacterium]
MSKDMSVAEYFERVVPELISSGMADASSDVTEQPEFTAVYDITGADGGLYGIRIHNGTVEVTSGDIPESDMRTTVSVEDWRQGMTADDIDPAIHYALRGKVRVIQGLKGALKVDLTREDDSNYESTILFGNTDTPEVTILMTAEDYVAMMRGDLNSQMAFMTNKLKFEGSLPLLMQMQALNM